MPKIDYKLKNGNPIEGVTGIIGKNLGWSKGGLMGWAWKQGKEGKKLYEERDLAADAGTLAHYLIDCDIKGRDPIIPDVTPEQVKQKGYAGFWNYLKWKSMTRFEPVVTETSMVSNKYEYGMTPDCIGKVGDDLCVMDYKTSNGVYEDMLIQLAAYKHGWEENFPDRPLVGGCHLLQLGKEDASFHHHFWLNLDEAWDAFLLCLGLNKIKAILKKKV